MLVPLLIFLIGLAGTLGLVPLFGHRSVRPRIGSAVLFGYVASGALAWWFVPSVWRMSFWKTLAASVDANTYGHPTEHYAQGIVAMMLFACVVGALASGVLAAATAKFWKKTHLA
ncbi:MAG: hypothetical protein NTW28_30060 [Candidatus Solibacter sp.]|nr:hypothetical protein [Candidatus Solibacter sp.]